MKEKGNPLSPSLLHKTDTPLNIHILTIILEWNLISLNMCPFKETGLGHRRVQKGMFFFSRKLAIYLVTQDTVTDTEITLTLSIKMVH